MKVLEECLARSRQTWNSVGPLLAAIKALLDLCERKVAAFQASGDAINSEVMLAVSAEVERLCQLASELAHVTAGVAVELRNSLAPELMRVEGHSTTDDEAQLIGAGAQLLELLNIAS